MRELFADRIEQTRKLFELSGKKEAEKSSSDARVTKEREVQALAKSIQESAMSQPVLKPVKGRAKAGPKKPKQRTPEDDKLLELALKVDQVALSAEEQRPKRSWGTFVIVGLVLVLLAATANKMFFAQKRKSSSGLVLWDGEPEEETEKPSLDAPSKGPGTTPTQVDAIPGADSNQPPDDPQVDTTPITTPPPSTPEKEPPAKNGTKKGPPPPPSGPPAEVVLALLPSAKVSKGKDVLGEGSLVKFSLPSGTHLLTIEGPDGVKRQLSVQANAAKKTVLKFTVADLPPK